MSSYYGMRREYTEGKQYKVKLPEGVPKKGARQYGASNKKTIKNLKTHLLAISLGEMSLKSSLFL